MKNKNGIGVVEILKNKCNSFNLIFRGIFVYRISKFFMVIVVMIGVLASTIHVHAMERGIGRELVCTISKREEANSSSRSSRVMRAQNICAKQLLVDAGMLEGADYGMARAQGKELDDVQPHALEGPHGMTPLRAATLLGFSDIAIRLVHPKADVNAQGSSGTTALTCASMRGLGAVVEALIEAKADVLLANKKGHFPLLSSSAMGHTQVVSQLLLAQANPNQQDCQGATALIVAAYKGYDGIVALLLEHKADSNARTKEGASVLNAAISGGHRSVVGMLLEKNVVISRSDMAALNTFNMMRAVKSRSLLSELYSIPE